MSPSSNVYVSATPGYTPAEGKDDRGYRRSQHTWLISVEPHKHHIPMLPRHKIEPVHFTAEPKGTEESGSYELKTHPTSGIIGTILLKEGAHGSAEDIRKILEDGLQSTKANVPSEQTPDGATDRWIRKGIHVLQDHHVIDSTDVGELMTFAHAYIAGRLDREGPSMIAYPKLHKNHKEKSQKHDFWLSYPTREAMRGRQDRADGDNDGDYDSSRKYGGLM